MGASLPANEALIRLMRAHAESLVRYAYSYLKSMAEAEDVAQEVFLSYLSKRPHFESAAHERAWLFRVAGNKCKNALKSGWFKSRNPIPERLPALEEGDREVLSAVLALEEKYRAPIHLYYYEDYSIREIAEILRAKPATVGTWLARGREILRGKLGGFDDEGEAL